MPNTDEFFRHRQLVKEDEADGGAGLMFIGATAAIFVALAWSAAIWYLLWIGRDLGLIEINPEWWQIATSVLAVMVVRVIDASVFRSNR